MKESSMVSIIWSIFKNMDLFTNSRLSNFAEYEAEFWKRIFWLCPRESIFSRSNRTDSGWASLEMRRFPDVGEGNSCLATGTTGLRRTVEDLILVSLDFVTVFVESRRDAAAGGLVLLRDDLANMVSLNDVGGGGSGTMGWAVATVGEGGICGWGSGWRLVFQRLIAAVSLKRIL